MPYTKPKTYSGHHSIVRNSTYIVLAKVTSRTLRVLYLIVLARVFGPELFGFFVYAQYWQVLFLSVALFGSGRILSRQIGRNPDCAEHYIGINISLRLLTTLTAASCCSLLALDPSLEPQGRELLLVFSLAILARSFATWIQQVFVAFEVTHFGLRQELLFRTLEVVLGLIALVLGGGLLVIGLIHALSWLLQAIFGWWLVRGRLVPIRFKWDKPALLDLAKTGVAFMLASLALSTLVQGSLVVYRFVIIDPVTLGQIAVVTQVLGLSMMLPKSVSVAALPVLSRWIMAGKGDERHSMTLILRTAMIGATAIALLMNVLAPLLIPLLVGNDYQLASELVGPALWLLLPLSVGTIINQLFTAHNQHWSTAISGSLGALIMVAVIVLSATDLGFYSVFLAIGLGAGIWAGIEIFLAVRQGWLDGFDTFGRPVLTILLAAISFALINDFSPWLALIISYLLLIPGIVTPWVLLKRLRLWIFPLRQC